MTKKERRLTDKEQSFVDAYINNNGNLLLAYEKSKYSQNLTQEQKSVQANKLFKRPNINLRIKSLQKTADKIAKEKFTITVEKRLHWLQSIVEAGLSQYEDGNGVLRRESLTAARGAIDTMNNMLGTDDNSDGVKPVKVFIGVEDAS